MRLEADVPFFKIKLLERIDYSHDISVFRFEKPDDFDYKPGQYATLAMELEGKLIQRAYSMVSSPLDNNLEFIIEFVAGGSLTTKMADLNVGDTLFLRNQAKGIFYHQDNYGYTRHLMVATVTGIAPYVSVIRTLAKKRDENSKHQIVLLHGASIASELCDYQNELDSIARKGWLEYVPTISRPWDEPEWTGETGRVEDLLRKYADGFNFNHENTMAYVCGHPQMILNAKSILLRARFKEEQIKQEAYFPLELQD